MRLIISFVTQILGQTFDYLHHLAEVAVCNIHVPVPCE